MARSRWMRGRCRSRLDIPSRRALRSIARQDASRGKGRAMKLRRVRLPGGAGFSVAIQHNDEWLPLRPALELHRTRGGTAPPGLEAASDDIIAFLQGGANLRAQATELLTELQPVLA